MNSIPHTKLKLLALGFIPFVGFLAAYLIPFIMTFRYSLLNSAFEKTAVGLDNYTYVLKNEYFRLGLYNLLKTGTAFCAAAFTLAMGIAWLMMKHNRLSRLAIGVLILPLMVPSICAVSLWQKEFDINILTAPSLSMFALFTLFIWKCTGPAAVILYNALINLPQDVTEAAALDGSGEARTFFCIQWPMLRSERMLSLLFLLMFYFRMYKESYLMFGRYPPENMYLIQHYMNNQYLKMNAQYVSAAAGSLAVICLAAFSVSFLLRGKKHTP